MPANDRVFVRVQAENAARVKAAFDRHGRQATFALLRTQNDIVLEAQAAIRSNLRASLTVRTAQTHQFLANRVQVTLAKLTKAQDRMDAYVKIADPESKGGRGKASLLATLASPGGGSKAKKSNYLAIPTPALRPSRAAVIPRAMYPSALGLSATRAIEGPVAFRSYTARRTRGGARVKAGDRVGLFKTAKGRYAIRGKQRTFAIDPRFMPRARSYGVFQRTGPGRGDVRKLWTYVPEVRVPGRVPARRIMNTVTARLFATRFDANLTYALRTAR